MNFVGWVLGRVADLLIGLDGVDDAGYWFWDKVSGFVAGFWIDRRYTL